MNAPPSAGWAARRPERQHVIAAYRFLLGRAPENEAAIEAHLAAAETIGDLRRRLMGSAEFRAQFDPTRWRPMPLDLPPDQVEARATPAELDALLERTGRLWAALGETAPHWSVVSDERFRPERLDGNRERFAATGEAAAAVALGVLARHGIVPEALPHCLEFGCGVGRMTLPLARRFARVTACDISAAHLALARMAAAEAGLGNIAWWQVTPAALLPTPPWDLWFSHIVLQHNPPPVARAVLEAAFAGLAPGGVALFQLVTAQRDYVFGIAEYLSRPPASAIEMHALPQAEVFALAAAAGVEVLEVRDDSHMSTGAPGRFISHLFLLRRPRR